MKKVYKPQKNSWWQNKIRFLSLILVFIGHTYISISQVNVGIANFVSNGGFEESFNCTSIMPKYWRGIDSLNSNGGSYCSACPNINNVPLNGLTYQWPKFGLSYILCTFYCLPPSCSDNSNRGYLRNRLKTTLQQGKTYCVKFYANITNSSTYGMDGFGAYFCDNSIDTITYTDIPLTYIIPQVQNPNGNIVTDTLNWTLITGTFVAAGIEKHLLVGNFKPNTTTNTLLINPTYLPSEFTDVCIDHVSCIDIDLPAYAGPDTYVVSGGSVYIGRERDVGIDEACIWYKLPNTTTAIDTAAGLWVSPTATSTYMVVQDICGNIKRDTVVVSLSGVGISEMESILNDIKLYPNPASDYVGVQYSLDLSNPFTGLSIFNNLGQLIREEEIVFKNKKVNIAIPGLANGVYFLDLRNSSGQTVKKRFVVAR